MARIPSRFRSKRPHLNRHKGHRSNGRQVASAHVRRAQVRQAARSVRPRSFSVERLARVRRRGGVLARVWTFGPPDSGMEIPHRNARTQRIRVSYALDGYCAPRSQCVGRPAPASARRQRPHPLDVQRQAHEVPLAAHLRQASQAESSESEHLLDPPRSAPPESHLRCAYWALPARLASFSPMRCVAGSQAGSTATRDLPSRPSATCASMPRFSSSSRSASLQ